MDKYRKRTLFICSRAVRLISDLFFFGLVALDILLEMASFDQVFDFVPQFGALLDGVANIFVVGAVLVFIYIWHVIVDTLVE